MTDRQSIRIDRVILVRPISPAGNWILLTDVIQNICQCISPMHDAPAAELFSRKSNVRIAALLVRHVLDISVFFVAEPQRFDLQSNGRFP